MALCNIENTQYWKNKDHLCVNRPCSDNAIPIIGVFQGDECFDCIRRIGQTQENAFDYDEYSHEESTSTFVDDADKVTAIINKRDQKPESTVGRVYPGIPLLTVTKALQRFKETDSEGRITNLQSFLPSVTPGQFNFSGVFLTNHGYQGVLHSFLRHNDQWAAIQPYVDQALGRMKVVKSQIDQIRNSYNASTARSNTNSFLRQLGSLTVIEHNEVQSALNDVQLVIVKTLQEKLEYANYRGEGLDNSGRFQTYFQVKDNMVAVLGYSRELFLPETVFDQRPFRTIITIYFIDDQECHRRTVMKSY